MILTDLPLQGQYRFFTCFPFKGVESHAFAHLTIAGAHCSPKPAPIPVLNMTLRIESDLDFIYRAHSQIQSAPPIAGNEQ
jgi:hypothetical protein